MVLGYRCLEKAIAFESRIWRCLIWQEWQDFQLVLHCFVLFQFQMLRILFLVGSKWIIQAIMDFKKFKFNEFLKIYFQIEMNCYCKWWWWWCRYIPFSPVLYKFEPFVYIHSGHKWPCLNAHTHMDQNGMNTFLLEKFFFLSEMRTCLDFYTWKQTKKIWNFILHRKMVLPPWKRIKHFVALERIFVRKRFGISYEKLNWVFNIFHKHKQIFYLKKLLKSYIYLCNLPWLLNKKHLWLTQPVDKNSPGL